MLNNIQKNLYIKIDKYNNDYNFYNYNKFKLYKIIPITYRSPTIFLDGLYFELPYVNLVNICKNDNTMTYNLTLKLDLNDNKYNSIYKLFKNIDNYNHNFFVKYKEKFNIKVNKSGKNTSSIQNIEFKMPNKNPLIKIYKYNSFYYIKDNNLYISVNIRHNYFIKIIELIYMNNNRKNKKFNEFIDYIINTLYIEYYELKNKKVNIDLNNINLLIKFWIKSCNLISEDASKSINMLWEICDYCL